MYIPSYQIHNVLNVYREQLSHGPKGATGRKIPAKNAGDRISISTQNQRQSIMDKISSEIVERIIHTGPENHFKSALADRLTSKSQQASGAPNYGPPAFKYTIIDQYNRKITNTLNIRGLIPDMDRD